MSIWRLVLQEARHRKLNFCLALISVAAAVGCVVGAETLLYLDRVVTAEILGRKQHEVESRIAQRRQDVKKAGDELQDVMRKTMKGLGFNVLILPAEQDLKALHLDGELETMPESYVDRLANSKIITVNHLLPSVSKKIRWKERDIDVVLTGTRGEVPIMHRGLKKPILDAVAPGNMVVGYEIHRALELEVGDKIEFMGKEFTISTLHPQRGSRDDATVWIDLAQAQEILGLQNLVHAILALECDCAGDRISQIRAEIGEILPGTQVIERHSEALARAEARAAAKEEAERALEREITDGEQTLWEEAESRSQIERRRKELAGVLAPMVVFASAVWVGLLAFGNARQRSAEIGILRAIGLQSRQIMAAFLSKAAIIGLIGALVGGMGGIAFGLLVGESPEASMGGVQTALSGSFPSLLGVCLIAAPLLSMIASWLPAMIASKQDPATVLQSE